MRKHLLTICSILIFASVSSAQTAAPRWELMGGYTEYLAGGEFSTNPSAVETGSEPGQIPTEGFQVGLSRSIKSYFRVVGEFNGVFGKETLAVEHLPPGGQYNSGGEVMAMFGPEAVVRTQKRFDFFAHFLIGVAHAWDNQTPALSNDARNSWNFGMGFGVDLKTSHRFAIRILEADWITSHFPKQDFDAEDNWRYSTGLIYRFGQ
jgi:hypothetical protein